MSIHSRTSGGGIARLLGWCLPLNRTQILACCSLCCLWLSNISQTVVFWYFQQEKAVCKKDFPRSWFGEKQDFSGFDQDSWGVCSNTVLRLWRRGGLMVSALHSRSGGLGLSPGQGHCVVFLGKTLYSHSASLHPGVQMGTNKCAEGNPAME